MKLRARAAAQAALLLLGVCCCAMSGFRNTLGLNCASCFTRSPHVSFCGYSIPHPATPVVHLRVQTTGTQCESASPASLQL